MAIMDFHNHVYPPEYVQAIRQGPSAYRVTFDADHNPVLHSPGDYNILVPGHRLMEARQAYGRIAITRTGCLGPCELGPTVLVYPDGVMYVGVRVGDVEEIFDQHLLGNQPVERLRAPAEIWG